MIKVDFGKIMKNARKHGDIKLVTPAVTKNYLASETNYHSTKKKMFWNEKYSNTYE